MLQLKVKPLSLRFRPRWLAGGDELCRAAEELSKAGHHLDCLNLVRRAAFCYLRAHLLLRAVKTLELGLSIALHHCLPHISRPDLLRLTSTVQSLHLTLNQPDDAVAALEVVAERLLEDPASPEDVERGLALLRKALSILLTSGRHSRAGTLALEMLNLSNSHHQTLSATDIVQVGKTCLNMSVITNNVNMAGTCLITLILLLIKHWENNAKAEAYMLYQDNVGNISKEVRDNLKVILEADWDRLCFDGDLETMRAKIRTGDSKERLLEGFLSSPQFSVGEEGSSTRRATTGRAKDSVILAGAALPLSVLAFKPGGRGGISQFREVQDQKKDNQGGKAAGRAVHADENGYEAFQPQDVGKPNY